MYRNNEYPLDVGERHEGAEKREIVIHLFPAVALNSNVSHSLVLDFLLIFSAFGASPLAAGTTNSYSRRRWRKRKGGGGKRNRKVRMVLLSV